MTRPLQFATILLAALATAAVTAAQDRDEIYLEITQPGLRKVAVATPPLLVLPGTPADAALTFQETLDRDLAAAAPIAIVDRKLYGLIEDAGSAYTTFIATITNGINASGMPPCSARRTRKASLNLARVNTAPTPTTHQYDALSRLRFSRRIGLRFFSL